MQPMSLTLRRPRNYDALCDKCISRSCGERKNLSKFVKTQVSSYLNNDNHIPMYIDTLRVIFRRDIWSEAQQLDLAKHIRQGV